MTNSGILTEARERLEKFLKDNKALYLYNDPLVSNISHLDLKWSEATYTVFINVPEPYKKTRMQIKKLHFCLVPQESRQTSSRHPEGQIDVRFFSVFNSVHRRDQQGLFLCSYSKEKNDLIFKPFRYLNTYVKIMKECKKWSYWKRMHKIAVTPKRRRKIKLSSTEEGVKTTKVCFVDIEAGPYEYYIVDSNNIAIEHKKANIIFEDEMAYFINKYNIYDPMFKLKLKTWANIIGGGNV